MRLFNGLRLTVIFSGLTFLVSGFQNCGGVNFNGIDPVRKGQAISGGAVIDDGIDDNIGDGGGGTNTPDRPSEDDEGKDMVTGITIQVDRTCSENAANGNQNITFVSSSSLKLEILNSSKQVVCSLSDSQSIKNQVLSSSRISLPTCSLANNSKYTLRLTGDQGKSVLYKDAEDRISFRKNKSIVIEVLADTNLKRADDMSDDDAQAAQPYCDHRKSPLVLDTRRNVKEKGVRLSSPEKGILFDIAGLNAQPVPHTKRRISWPKSKRYEFLVLPNAQGKVDGINEMFGDNTLGPDGQFAANGFLALAKYDLNGDGVISEKDGVYSHLRLWSDRNRDGVAKDSELRSLEEAEIEAIDILYDDSYQEIDRYGNMTKYKSVVKFNDGEYRLVFDVWFKDFGSR